MNILLCAATEMEIAPAMEWIRKRKMDQVRLLITGVGLTSATYALTRSVMMERPEFVLQAGWGGWLDESGSLGDVVAIRNESIGDLGVEEKDGFRSLFSMGLVQPDHFPWTNGLLTNTSAFLEQCGLPVTDSVTVNEISTRKERMGLYRNSGVRVESMEGAALHYVALSERLPFLQIRVLSNFAGERDKSKWVMEQSIQNLNQNLQNILIKLSS